ncbi:hypothetical protein [Streptomyces atratus]
MTLSYADGTTSTGTVAVPDWAVANPPATTVVAAGAGRVNGSARSTTTSD